MPTIRPRFLVSAAAFAALAAALAFSPFARSQIQATPSFTPIGVSASGNGSTAWFHELSSRQVLACQTSGQGSSLAIQCVTAKLP